MEEIMIEGIEFGKLMNDPFPELLPCYFAKPTQQQLEAFIDKEVAQIRKRRGNKWNLDFGYIPSSEDNIEMRKKIIAELYEVRKNKKNNWYSYLNNLLFKLPVSPIKIIVPSTTGFGGILSLENGYTRKTVQELGLWKTPNK